MRRTDLALAALTIGALAPLFGPMEPAHAQTKATTGKLDALIDQFNAGAPAPPGNVRLDAWVEANDGGRELVVVVEPEGEIKLVADPGITVTPEQAVGIQWQVPLPHRHVDADISYFTPPASIRLPFTADDDRPFEVLVEYAYCLVDYQCFFGEETLTVAAR